MAGQQQGHAEPRRPLRHRGLPHQVCTQRGYHHIGLGVDDQNLRAAALYLRLGYQETGCRYLDRYHYIGDFYGHFGQGLVHTRIDFGLKNQAGIQKYLSFTDEASDLVARYRGSLSGEHGDGQSKAEFLPKLFGPELVRAFAEFKTIFDPDWKMNPGKLVRIG